MDQESAWQCSGCLATSTLDVGRRVAWTRRGPADMCIPCYRQRKTGILAVYLIGCTLLVIALGAFDLRYRRCWRSDRR